MSGPNRISVSGAVRRADVARRPSTALDEVHAVVGQRLHLGGGVDVHHDHRAGMLGLPRGQLVGGDRVGQRAAGVEVGDQHASSRGERIDAVSAMKCTPQKTIVSASVAAAWRREAERVADVVGDVLDLGHLVVVGEDHRVALRRERAYLVLQRPSYLRAERRASGHRQGQSGAAACWGAIGRFISPPPR